MLLTSLLAQSSAKNNGGGDPGLLLIMMGLLFAVMYFLVIRPQKKRMRESQNLLAALKEGDEVVTTGGVLGFINAIDGDIVWLDIADNTEIRIVRSAIARRIDANTEAAGGEPKAALPETADDPAEADEKK